MVGLAPQRQGSHTMGPIRRARHHMGRTRVAQTGALDGRAHRPSTRAGADRRRGGLRLPCGHEKASVPLDAATRHGDAVPSLFGAAPAVAKVPPKPSPVRCARLAAVFDLSRWSGLIEGEVRPRARTVASNRWAQVASRIQRPTRVPHRRPRHRRPPLPDRIRQPARPGQDYSPECVEGVFCELRPRRILGRLQAPRPCYFVIKCWPPCNLRVSSRCQAGVLVQAEPIHGGARR